jgi:Concanavalin A-like lectin/glucanases superfamily
MHGVLQRQLHFSTRVFLAFLFVLLVLLLFTSVAAAQPFGAWPVLGATQGKYIEVPDSPDLNPAAQITIEAWVSNFPTAAQGQPCRSVIGKNYLTAWWVGICNNSLRSWMFGVVRSAGNVPNGQWTHVAVTYDGAHRNHYINGELVASYPETGPIGTNAANLRIASDVGWDYQPQGSIDEVRLWNVARTVEQIRASINVPITTAQPGLVAVWPLDANTTDVVGGHNGANVGGVVFLNFPVTITCGGGTATGACLNTRFWATIQFRDPNTQQYGTAQVVDCPNPDSALFWFFAPNAWEVMVKTVNACGFNNRFWAFSAATTNVFYRLEVLDVRAGANKIYFNYPGPPAPAVTDTAAFATCP